MAIYQSLLILMAGECTQYLNINWAVFSSIKDAIGKNLNFFILSISTFSTRFYLNFWTSHLAGDCLLTGAKLFSTITKEERLQENKELGEYEALKKRRSRKYKGPEEKKRPEEDEKPQKKKEESQKREGEL